MKTDCDLKKDLLAQFEIEPSVNAEKICISVTNGMVTLTGSVSNYAEKLAAGKAVKRLNGMRGFADNLVVDLHGSYQRTDAEIAGAANDAINWITTVPTQTIKITARDGWINLEGTLESWRQKDAAENAVHHLNGVIGVTNSITVNAVDN